MSAFESAKRNLKNEPKTWLITGVAGFIGSNLLEVLLKLDQRVIGLDNFSTGQQRNLNEVKSQVAKEQWANFQFMKGDIRNLNDCHDACDGVDFILHQAALGSVPRSIEDPISTNESNIVGFLNVLVAARDANVKRFIYAASSSTYGDSVALPKIEDKIGKPLSPYAVTKLVNELYADVFSRTYGVKSIGLRYFNVFGPRQDPNGSYAAVIPKWIKLILKNQQVEINGDGETSRDFCYIENVVQANILAASCSNEDGVDKIYNIAAGEKTSLNQLYSYLKTSLKKYAPQLEILDPVHIGFRPGDVRHSLADISKAKRSLGYEPTHRVADGLNETISWYAEKAELLVNE